MLGISPEALVQFVENYGLLAVFIGMILEEVLFVIPASVIIVSAGAIMVQSTSLIPALIEIFLEIAIIGSLGITIGSFFMYGIGFYGGRPAINFLGRYTSISWEDVQRFEDHFSSEREKQYLAVFRILPVFPITTVSAAAGLFRMDWKPYTLITFLGMFPRHIGYAYLGWKASANYEIVLAKISQFSRSLTIAGVALIAVYLLYHRYGAKIKDKTHQTWF